MKRALVTGAHGFVGRHVARRLAAEGFVVEGLGHGGWGSVEFSRAWGLRTWYMADVTVDSRSNLR